MSVFDDSTQEKRAPGYACVAASNRHAGEACQSRRSTWGDAAVTQRFLGVVSPAKSAIALRTLEDLEADQAEARKQWELQRQRADYAAELSRRR